MTCNEALNNIVTISEILVEVSKSHITPNKAINEIRRLDISGIYFTLRKLQSELEVLKRDVARYFELWGQAKEKWGNGLDDKEANEYTKLHLKLSKVGKKDE